VEASVAEASVEASAVESAVELVVELVEVWVVILTARIKLLQITKKTLKELKAASALLVAVCEVTIIQDLEVEENSNFQTYLTK
jgi:hypothetical protein